MSSDAGSDVLRIENRREIISDVIEFARRVRIALSLEKAGEMEVIVHDRSAQLCALVGQGGFVLLGLKSELGCRGDPEISLRVDRDCENPDVYRVEGIAISLETGPEEVSVSQVSNWIRENGIDECENITITEEGGHLRILIDVLT